MPPLHIVSWADGAHQTPALLLLLLFVVSASCGGESKSTPPTEAETVHHVPFPEVTQAQWKALGERRIVFGHQSVGGNILDGVADVLSRHPDIPLRVAEAGSIESTRAPRLLHARIGINGEPATKVAAFTAIVDKDAPDVAVMKFCYLDVENGADPDSLFTAYQRSMAELRARHPGLVVVHVTMPLTVDGSWKGRLLNTLRGRQTSRDLNARRDRYNSLMRAAYDGQEPVFDLARIESTRLDGTRTSFPRGGAQVPFLAPELTSDGGHLNAAGQRTAAEAFLALLASL